MLNTKYWDIIDIRDRIFALREKHKVSDDITARLLILLHRLYRLNESFYLPQVQVDYNSDYTIEFCWFDRRNERALSFTLEDADIVTLALNKNHASEIRNPSDSKIVTLLQWMGGIRD